MADAVDSGIVADQVPRLGQAPTICRLCDVQLSGGETFRAHAKSDLHVYNLRMKVAEPDSAASPPTPPLSSSPIPKHTTSLRSARRKPHDPSTMTDESQETHSEGSESSDEEAEIPEFNAAQCIFCLEEFADLDSSLEHMATSHGFIVPFQELLAVDLETVIWYLHFVIYGYKECISCGTKRSTPEAAQQHMMAKGHCRFDITGEMEDFYEMPKEENMILERTRNDTTGTVRLPSGKIISNRNFQEPQEPRQRAPRSNPFLEALTEGSPQDRPQKPQSSSASKGASSQESTSTELASRKGQEQQGGQMVRSSEALLAAQLSRLVLAGDRAQIRLEARKRGKMERKNNKILQKHFKLDAGDSRAGRNFCK